MGILKLLLAFILGLIILPITWILRKLGIVKTPPDPEDFVRLTIELHKRDLWPALNMRYERINNTEALGWFIFGSAPSNSKVVTVARCANDELAATVELEMVAALQYTDVHRKGRYVMGCTFSPEDPVLTQKFRETFFVFGGAG